MTIYLHIGMQKTGSSSLERTFAQSRRELAAAGIDYPDFGGIAHHDLAWAVRGARRVAEPAARLAAIRTELARSRAAKIVLSSENFCGLHETHVSALPAILPPGRLVCVVCYFRHPIDWVEAQINQKIKSSDATAVRPIVPTYIARTDYFSMIERWAAIFGAGAIRARIYRSGTDVIADFLRVIEADPAVKLRRSSEPVNVSLSESLIRIKQIANRYGHSRALRAALNDIQIATNMGPRARFLSRSDTRKIIAVASGSLDRLWETYIDKSEPRFDLSPPAEPSSGMTREERRATLNALVKVLAPKGKAPRAGQERSAGGKRAAASSTFRSRWLRM